MPQLSFNEETNYSLEKFLRQNEVFHSIIVAPFQFEPDQKIRVVMSHK